jgi:hypothetical protein
MGRELIGELAADPVVLASLTWLEAQVLQQNDIATVQRSHGRPGARPDYVSSEYDPVAE